MPDPLFLHVLDGLDPVKTDRALAELKPLVRRASVDLASLDFEALRVAGSSGESEALKPPDLDGPAALTPRYPATVVRYAPRSWQDYEPALERAVNTSGDAELAAAWKQTRRMTGANARSGSAAGYLAGFLPEPDELAARPTPWLRRMLRAFADALKALLHGVKRLGSAVLAVLEDPDAYYLRLRGEVTEFCRRHGGGGMARGLFFLPDLFRLYVRLLLDPRVSLAVKGELLVAVAYLVAPFDLVPEALLGPAGYVDDVAFLALALAQMLDRNAVAEGLLGEHWAGDPGTLKAVMAVSEWAGSHAGFLGELWRQFAPAAGAAN